MLEKTIPNIPNTQNRQKSVLEIMYLSTIAMISHHALTKWNANPVLQASVVIPLNLCSQ